MGVGSLKPTPIFLCFITRLLAACELVDNDLTCSLSCVWSNSLELVLRSVHCACSRHITCKVDSVEFTLGCAKSASDTTVLINGCSTASKTSCCLSLNLLLCKSKSKVIEGILGNSGLLARNLSLCVIKALNLDIVFIKLDELSSVTCKVKTVSFMNETVDGYVAFSSACNSINGELSSCKYISAYEDIRLCCLSCECVSLSCAVSVELNLCSLKKVSPLN